MKYILFEGFSGNIVPFVFPDRVDHVDMRDQLPYGKVLSAGYVQLVDGHFVCSGSVAELQAEARQDDASLLESMFAAPVGLA